MSTTSGRPERGLPNTERLLADPAARPSGSALVWALAADLDAAVLVTEPDGTVRARAGNASGVRGARQALGGEDPLAEARAGQRGWSVRTWPLSALGGRTLTVGLRRPWTPAAEASAGRAATVIATALLADDTDAERDRLTGARRAVWGSVLQLLMTGQIAEAQRVANALSPRILDTERIRVHVLAGRSRDRESLLSACETRLAGLAVSVSCAARPGHVIIIEPVDDTEPAAGPPTPVHAFLGELTAASAGRSLGTSRAHPVSALPDGYAQAVGALATAVVRPNRMADAEESRTLTDVLPASAGGWASALLAPLAAADEDGTLRHTLAVALTFTRGEAARILGVHRNTVHARLATAAGLLHADLSRMPERAAIDLALRAQPADGHGALADVLGDPQLKAWATGLLDRLDGAVVPRGPARMRDLLRAFTRADGGITAAAYAVGLSPNSASRWLVAAEATGRLRLRHGYGGAHEVAVALAAVEGPGLLSRS